MERARATTGYTSSERIRQDDVIMRAVVFRRGCVYMFLYVKSRIFERGSIYLPWDVTTLP